MCSDGSSVAPWDEAANDGGNLFGANDRIHFTNSSTNSLLLKKHAMAETISETAFERSFVGRNIPAGTSKSEEDSPNVGGARNRTSCPDSRES
jgi:hypothetical protein